MECSFTPHSLQNKLPSVFLILAILAGEGISLSVFQRVDINLLRVLCLGLHPIFNRLFVLLMTNFLSSLYILEISPLSDVGLVKIFPVLSF